MQRRPLGRTGLMVSPLGFGAFKIGRNQKTKYPGAAYALPDDAATESLLDGLVDLRINYIDTAPAYGLSEERIGRWLARGRDDLVISTKVGETFEGGTSSYDFSEKAIRISLERSLARLQAEVLDLVFLHCPAEDYAIQVETPAVQMLQKAKAEGRVRAIGLSGKTVEGARLALHWADVLMVEYHLNDTSHAEIIAEAARRGIGVVVKKGLAAGHLPAQEALRFVLGNPHVNSVVVGGLNLEHIRANVRVAEGIAA